MEPIEAAPSAKQQHKNQTLWQIWVPLIAAILVMLFLCVMAVLLTARDASGDFNTKWAGISVVYLAIPAFFEGFIILLILAGLIFLVSKLLQYTPVYTQKASDILNNINFTLRQYSDKAAMPVISLKSAWSGFTTLLKRITFRSR